MSKLSDRKTKRKERKEEKRYTKADKKISNAKNKKSKDKAQKKYGYNYDSAIKAGLHPDKTGHWASRNPDTGEILKGRKHPTIKKTKKAEKELGYKIKRKKGIMYSIKREKR